MSSFKTNLLLTEFNVRVEALFLLSFNGDALFLTVRGMAYQCQRDDDGYWYSNNYEPFYTPAGLYETQIEPRLKGHALGFTFINTLRDQLADGESSLYRGNEPVKPFAFHYRSGVKRAVITVTLRDLIEDYRATDLTRDEATDWVNYECPEVFTTHPAIALIGLPLLHKDVYYIEFEKAINVTSVQPLAVEDLEIPRLLTEKSVRYTLLEALIDG